MILIDMELPAHQPNDRGSHAESHRPLEEGASQRHQDTMQGVPLEGGEKDAVWSNEEDERVCRVCCMSECDAAGEDALTALGISGHIPLLDDERKLRLSLSLDKVRSKEAPDHLLLNDGERPAPGKGSFSELAAGLARRVFQKEEVGALDAMGPSLTRSRSLSNGMSGSAALSSQPLPRTLSEAGVDLEQGVGRSERELLDRKAPCLVGMQEPSAPSETVQMEVLDGPRSERPGSAEVVGGERHTEGPSVVASNHSKLLRLGCACQGDLALVHYSCFLRWVVSRAPSASTCDNHCEICEQPAANVSQADIDVIRAALRQRRRVVAGQRAEETGAASETGVASAGGSDTDASALGPPVPLSAGEVPLDAADLRSFLLATAWFDPLHRLGGTSSRSLGRGLSLERVLPGLADATRLTRGTRALVEVLALVLATALLTLTLSRLFISVLSPGQIGFGLHYILAAIISFIAVVWFRIVAIPRLRSGPARSGAVVMCIWLMVLGVWFSGTKPPNRPAGQ